MIQLWSAVAVTLLSAIIGPIISGELSGRLAKRIGEHVAFREKLVGNTAALEHLDALLTAETEALKTRETQRLERKLNGGSVAALVFVIVIGVGLVIGLVTAAINTEQPWSFVFTAFTVVVGLLTIGFTGAGLGQLYAPPHDRKAKAAAGSSS